MGDAKFICCGKAPSAVIDASVLFILDNKQIAYTARTSAWSSIYTGITGLRLEEADRAHFAR